MRYEDRIDRIKELVDLFDTKSTNNFSNIVGIDNSNLNKILKGKKSYNRVYAEGIAKNVIVNVDYLIDGVGELIRLSNTDKISISNLLKDIANKHGKDIESRLTSLCESDVTEYSNIKTMIDDPSCITLNKIKMAAMTLGVPFYTFLVKSNYTGYNKTDITPTRTIKVDTVELYNSSTLRKGLDSTSVKSSGNIHIPHMGAADGAIVIQSDTFYPTIRPGDSVIYKKLKDKKDVIPGELYLVETSTFGERFLSVFRVYNSEVENSYRLVSENPTYQPRDVRLDDITAIAIVKYSIRKHVMG